MDPRAYRIANAFVARQIKRAKYAPEFLRVVEPQKFRNPETDREVKFISLPDDEQKRIYEQWRSKNNVQEQAPQPKKPTTPEEITARNIDIVRNGREVAREVLSSGGAGGPGVNESYIVSLEKDGQTQEFIYKPAEGEKPFLRVGITNGQYHSREQAAYSIDAMLGDGGVVPVTHTRGKDSGSYQLWAEGARAMRNSDLNDLVEKVPVEQLSSSPDFQRVNVMDLIMGHEDRHRGNLLYYFEGDETPENLRFVAIDNGLSMAAPSTSKDHRVYINPFQGYYAETDDMSWEEQVQAKEKGIEEGDKAVAESLSKISPELHEKIKKLDLGKMAKSMTSAGIDDEGAVRAALVRVAALQADPTIFKDILQRHGGDLEEAWKDFQHLSGFKDDLLWRSGAGNDAEKKIDDAVKDSRPQGGWAKPFSLDDYNNALQDLDKWADDNWASASPDDATKPNSPTRKTGPKEPVPKPSDADLDFSMLASVRDRWLSSLMKIARGNTLTISEVTRGKKPRVVGVFELGRNGKVKESYKDTRFRFDIQRGVRLMGKRFVPKDGAKFMGALEKVYGSRSLFDVKRT